MPDPARAHGAWVYLVLSIVAGGLTAARGGIWPALLGGLGFAGVFLVASTAALGPGERARRLLLGIPLALVPFALALVLGAAPIFFAYALVAIPPAALAAFLAERCGFQSSAALAAGIATLVVAAPCAACAGGADLGRLAILFASLAPFYVWRALTVRRLLESGGTGSRAALRARGWREALYGVLWTAAAVGAIHLAG